MGEQPDLDEELDRLQERMPDGVSRVMQKVRGPAVARYRIPVGIALTVGGVFGFLPVLGILDGAARACRDRPGRAGDAPAAGAPGGARQSQAFAEVLSGVRAA